MKNTKIDIVKCNYCNCKLTYNHFLLCDNECIYPHKLPDPYPEPIYPTHPPEVPIRQLQTYLSDSDDPDGYKDNDVVEPKNYFYKLVEKEDCEHNWIKDYEQYIEWCDKCYEERWNNIIFEVEVEPSYKDYKFYYSGYTLKKYENKLIRDLRGFDSDLEPFYISRDFAFKLYDYLDTQDFINWDTIRKGYKEIWGHPKLQLNNAKVYLSARYVLDLPDIKYDIMDLHNVAKVRKYLFNLPNENDQKASSLNYFYTLYKVMQIHTSEDKLQGIPLKIAKLTLLKNESKWKTICKLFGWKYKRLLSQHLKLKIDTKVLREKWISNNLLTMSPIIT